MSALSDQTKVSRVLDLEIFVSPDTDAEAKVLRWLVHQAGYTFKTGGRKRGGDRIFVTQGMWARMLGIKDPKKLGRALKSLRAQGYIEVDQGPGRNGFPIAEYRLSPGFVSWACLVYDQVWDADGGYPGLLGLWKQAETDGLAIDTAHDLLNCYWPDRYQSLVEAGSNLVTDDEQGAAPTESVVSQTPPQIESVVSQTPPPKEDRAEDLDRGEDLLAGQPPRAPRLEVGTKRSPDPDSPAARAPAEGTHAWVVAKFEAEMERHHLGTKFNRDILNGTLRSLREKDGYSNKEIAVLVGTFFARGHWDIRAKRSEHDPAAMFRHRLPQLEKQADETIRRMRSGKESAVDRGIREINDLMKTMEITT